MSAVASDVTPAVPAEQVPTLPTPVSEEADSSNVNWADYANEMTSDSSEDAPAPAPIVPAVAEETPPTPPAVEPPPVAVEVQPPKVEEPPPVVEPKTESEIPAITPPPEIKVDDFVKLQADYVENASKQYEMTEEQALMFATEPNKVLPRLAAQVEHTVLQNVLQSITQVLQQILPQYIEHQTSVRETTTKAESSFFDKWGELKQHKDRVMEVGRIYRQMKPQATAEEFIRDVGMQVWMAVGLPPEKMAARILAKPSAPAQVPAPVQAGGFMPANPGARTAGISPSPSNPFTDLTHEILQTQNSDSE